MKTFFLPCLALALSGCATLTEPLEQTLQVQTVFEHREVRGVGCVLSNPFGRWFVTSPGRVTVRRSFGDLQVDCRQGSELQARESIASKENTTLWTNVALTAGIGYYVDKQTGAGFDYPATLTVVLQRAAPLAAPPNAGTAGTPVF
ncbi:hypothetical protein [Massilia sp. TS11]|uniref:hypothetical protein n=1 Tax=Massilia sp. TS11 TaxID=2908003 RepID=UPI001EDC7960|nr:hypothetical protein [Massilia sp. TS11]MCG2586593.1 hypothetical protein [Massilia sp. TS11]